MDLLYNKSTQCGDASDRHVAMLVVLITSPTTCQDVVDLLYNFLCVVDVCTTNPEQIELMEYGL